MNIPEKYQKPLSILIFVGSLAVSIGVLFIRVDPQQLAALGYGGIFLITLLGGLTIFIPGPTFVAAFIIGSVLNPFLVAVIAGLGSAIGETTGYAAGYASRALVVAKVEGNRWYARLLGWMTHYPFLTIFIVAAIPNFLTDLSGLIAGRIKYPYFRFILATFFGKTIRFGIGAVLGSLFGRSILHL